MSLNKLEIPYFVKIHYLQTLGIDNVCDWLYPSQVFTSHESEENMCLCLVRSVRNDLTLVVG
jgi:hypothetical protein